MLVDHYKNKDKKVILGMSGGVDSSVSAWLLKKNGYNVEGLFMKNWEEDDTENFCSSAQDLSDARSVCKQLKIVLHTVNFSLEYWNNVFNIFLSEYQSGRTPNPDILCNKEIKFKSFLNFAMENLGADFIATGHYVRRYKFSSINQLQLLRGIDQNKDQSYFLYTLSHNKIKKCLFPVGTLTKNMVRHIAYDLNLKVAKKKDSTGICFIGKKNFSNFLRFYFPIQPGIIVTVNNQKIGEHHGLMYYTLGQRKGLGIGGIREKYEKPWYVVDKDLINNKLIVAQEHNHPRLMSLGFVANKLHWVDRKPLNTPFRCTVKIRYCQPSVHCWVEPLSEDSIQVNLYNPIRAVTPGQSAVFYIEDRCLGGGIIEDRHSISYP